MTPAHSAGLPSVAMPMLNLVPGGMGGTETYTANLTRQLVDAGVEVHSVLPANAVGAYPWTRQTAAKRVSTGLGLATRATGIGAALAGAPAIRRALARADLVHYPFTALLPAPARGQPCVVTLHDVQHLDLPENFGRADAVYRSLFYHRAARRADRVITISEFAKRSIVSHLGIAADRVDVVPLGVDAARFSANLGARDDVLLYPARGWPHKNHARLLEAVVRLRRTRPGMRLVLTGGNLEAIGPLPAWVERRGLVSDDELAGLYRRAAALVFPSLYEGFGLPPLEAMASGCPVAASDAGSIPEVCGSAAVLFDAKDPAAIAAGIEETLARGGELTALGLERVKEFTWEACRDRHIEVYRRVVGER